MTSYRVSSTRSFVARWQFVLFIALAYALSWWTAPIMNGAILPYGPALAAVIILALVAGRGGLSDLWQWVTRPTRWVWYLIAPGLMAAIALGALALNLLLGASITSVAHLQPWVWLATVGQLLLLGGQWEEPGWSGYALPYWRRRLGDHSLLSSPLAATLIVGAVRAVWHLPLVLSGAIPWYDALFYSFALQFMIVWLYERTEGNLLVIMLFHLASNVFIGSIMTPLFAGADLARYYGLFIGLAWLAVLVLFRFKGKIVANAG